MNCAVRGEVHINRGGIQGPVSKEGFYGQKIRAVLVKVGAKSVSEGMAGEALLPSKPALVLMDMPGEIKSVDWLICATLFWKKPAHRLPISKPVLCEQIHRNFGKDRETVLTGFGMADMDAHIFPVDILITEMADFPDTQAGGIHDGSHSLLFQVGHGRYKFPDILLRRDKWEIRIKPARWELSQGLCNT